MEPIAFMVFSDGTVFSWGKNSRGRLGRSDDTPSEKPSPVSLAEEEAFEVVSLACCHGTTLLATRRTTPDNNTTMVYGLRNTTLS